METYKYDKEIDEMLEVAPSSLDKCKEINSHEMNYAPFETQNQIGQNQKWTIN